MPWLHSPLKEKTNHQGARQTQHPEGGCALMIAEHAGTAFVKGLYIKKMGLSNDKPIRMQLT